MAKIFIEADAIAHAKMSGVGHTVLEIVRVLDGLAVKQDLDITLIVPFGGRAQVRSYGFRNIKIKRLPPGRRVVNYLLARTSLPLPVDLWFGRGTYLFLNYKTWYVPFSRSIGMVYDLAFRSFPQTVSPKNRVYLEKNFPRWLKRADTLLSISSSSAEELERYYPAHKSKVVVVHLGVDPAVFHRRTAREIAEVAQKHNFPKQYFLFVGNLEPRKNLSVLLDAYKLYSDATKHSIPLLLVGGDGWNNEAVKAKLRDLQERRYEVYQNRSYVGDEDLPALYSGATALVHIAVHEGFGLPPVQAQACGTPVIVSDLPVFHETLQDNSTTYVANPTPRNVADALLAQNGAHFADYAPLTWEKTTQKIISVVNSEE